MSKIYSCKKFSVLFLQFFLISTIFLLSSSGFVLATESTMVIQLQKKIKANVDDFKMLNQDYLKRQKEMKDSVSRTHQKIAEEMNPDRRMEFAKEYYLSKAQYLHLLAEKVTTLEDKVVDMVVDMDRLEKLVRKGMNKETNVFDEKSKPVVKSMVNGIANLLEATEKMNPELEYDKHMINARNTLLNLNSRYRDMHEKGAEFNLREQIDYLIDLKAYLNSASGLIERQTLHIRTDIYRLVQIEIQKSAEDIYNGIADFQATLEQERFESEGVIASVQEGYDNIKSNNNSKINSRKNLRDALNW